MGRNQLKAMTEEERAELSIGLLREWWISATQSLVKEVGSEKALNQLKPYFYNTGCAGGQNIPKILGVTEENSSQYDIGIHMWPLVTGGKLNGVFVADDGTQIYEYTKCGTSGRSREGCICMCQYTWHASVSNTNPGREISLVKSLSFGDQACDVLGRVIGVPQKVASTSEFKVPDDQLPPLLNKDIWEYLALAYVGECWSNATRAFFDLAGPDKALSMLRFQMKGSGNSFGARMKERLGAREGSMQSIRDLIDLVQTLHQQNSTIISNEASIECIIGECPFSSSPPEICLQYEAFFNGICEAIDPSYEFYYDRMMTKGDQNCHWTIRKKGDVAKSKPSESSDLDEMLKKLKWRLTNGEITPEQYHQLRDVLLEK
jgi:hypothetical protein